MKALAADESLSEEARESAKKALEVMVASQLLDIEQAAALKKLESEAQFADEQARIQRHSALQKLEAEEFAAAKELEVKALAKRKTLDAEKLDLVVEADKLVVEAEKVDVELQKAHAAQKGHSRQLPNEEMTEWLRQQRLTVHTASFTRIAGWCVACLVLRAFAQGSSPVSLAQGHPAERSAVPDGREHRGDREHDDTRREDEDAGGTAGPARCATHLSQQRDFLTGPDSNRCAQLRLGQDEARMRPE